MNPQAIAAAPLCSRLPRRGRICSIRRGAVMNPRILEMLHRVAAYLRESLSYVDDPRTAELYAEVIATIREVH